MTQTRKTALPVKTTHDHIQGSSETLRQMRCEADEAIPVMSPEEFRSVGEWYGDFAQTTDDEVRESPAKARGQPGTN